MLNSCYAEFYFWIDVQGICLEILYRVTNVVARFTRVHQTASESCDRMWHTSIEGPCYTNTGKSEDKTGRVVV